MKGENLTCDFNVNKLTSDETSKTNRIYEISVRRKKQFKQVLFVFNSIEHPKELTELFGCIVVIYTYKSN